MGLFVLVLCRFLSVILRLGYNTYEVVSNLNINITIPIKNPNPKTTKNTAYILIFKTYRICKECSQDITVENSIEALECNLTHHKPSLSTA
jgi:hypothetical protein